MQIILFKHILHINKEIMNIFSKIKDINIIYICTCINAGSVEYLDLIIN